MHFNILDIESEILNKPFGSIVEFQEEHFQAFEQEYCSTYKPWYVGVKIPLDAISSIHTLEYYGFRLVEIQFEDKIAIKACNEPTTTDYSFRTATDPSDLPEILDIASSVFLTDRFSQDPALPSDFSGERYKRYVTKSFSDPLEKICCLIDNKTNEVVAFKTHRYTSKAEVQFYLNGVSPKYQKLGLGLICDSFHFHMLYTEGIKRGFAMFSGTNYHVMNLLHANPNIRIRMAWACFRKIY